MLNILLSGACGKMGNMITESAKEIDNVQIAAGVDISPCPMPYPVYKTIGEVKESTDVIIDFSHVSTLDSLLSYAKDNKKAIVLATTGYSKEQIEKIKDAAKVIPVFFSANMSLGINLLSALAKKAAMILGSDFDVEIVEKHHNQKIDAPSGTALMLANAVNSVFDDKYNYEFDRHSKRLKRPQNEIGIHSVRGGTIVGEHDIIFAGKDEVITLSHHAASKQVFANGAIKAAIFIAEQKSGLYDMNDILAVE